MPTRVEFETIKEQLCGKTTPAGRSVFAEFRVYSNFRENKFED